MLSPLLPSLLACIDHTTLNATDSDASVAAFCRKALSLHTPQAPHVAAVCVYPRFVAVAKQALAGSPIRVAAVAGAFPHGQLPLHLKVDEVTYAVSQGADEIDIVINRGALLAGDDRQVSDEITAMRQACQARTLKVIVETCDLPTPSLIRHATELAINAGADFVKTSTGKGAAGATAEGAAAMLAAIADHRSATGRTVGFKAAGAIRTPEQALLFAQQASDIMGPSYIHPLTFRIGASSLTPSLL